MAFKKRYIFIPITTAICCYMPALLLYFLAYDKITDWNNDLIRINCIVTNHSIEEHTCTYDCNCITIVDGPTHCDLCKKNCYDGSIYIIYQVESINYNKSFEIYSDDNDKNDVQKGLNKKFPIGKKIDCYYKDDPVDIRLKKKNTKDFKGAFIMFLVFGSIILLTSGLIEIAIHYIKKNRNNGNK